MPLVDIEKRKEYKKLWYEKNKKRILLYHKEYNQKNKEKRREYCILNKDKIAEQKRKYTKEYYIKNSYRIKNNVKRWKQTPNGRFHIKLRYHNRRIKEKGLTREIIQQVYEENIKKYGTLTCELCNKPVKFGEDALEHFTPLVRGGSNKRENLGVSHGNNSVEKCNTHKYTKTLEEWFKLTSGVL